MKILKKFEYLYWYSKIKHLEDKIQKDFFTKFDKTKKVTIYYIAGKRRGYSDSLEYAFYKVYDLWGTDGLSASEKEFFK